MNRSEHPHIVGFCERVALFSCLLVVACGDKSTAAMNEPSLSSAATETSVTGSAGKAGSSSAPGNRTSSATAEPGPRGGTGGKSSPSDAGTPNGAAVGGSVGTANNAAVGGTSNSAAMGGSGDTANNAAVSGSGGTTNSAAASGSGGTTNSAATGGGASGGGASGSAAAGSDASGSGATVTLTGQVIEVHTDGNFTPYGGAEVCVLDSMPRVCATADGSGKLVIKLPANARTGLTMDLPGLFPMLTPITTGDADIDLSGRGEWSNYGAAVVLNDETRTAATSMLGTTLDPNMGQADMIVFGLSSGTVTLEGTPAELKWFASGGRFTVTDDAAPFGSVLHGFTNVEPGMRTFRAEMNGKPCAFDPMLWPGAEPGTVNVPMRAGWWTRLMEVRCN